MEESRMIEDGEKLGLAGKDLIKYVEQRKHEKKVFDNEQREERQWNREQDKIKI